MDHVYPLRISRSWEVLKDCVAATMVDDCHVLVYEHPADDEVKRTHCHFLISSNIVDCEGLKKRISKHHKFYGNSDWSNSRKEYETTDKYISYMSKGIFDPVFNLGYERPHIDTLKSLWVITTDKPSVVEPLIVREASGNIKKEQNLTDQYQAYLDELLENVSSMPPNLSLDSFRGPSLLYWRKRNGGLLPQTSTYKRFLASLYLEYRDLKRLPLAEEAIECVKNFYG